MVTLQDVEEAKVRGRYRLAGQLQAIRGHDNVYGCHYGMTSTCELARLKFQLGWHEVNNLLVLGDLGDF